ncbi:MAG: GerMN domain-containing protein [Candidatus Tectomicrobia bacterium]|uniref:GerMN domain-containing protein n=1 Tax=Tectimicrobiota bacterium TaxID=2528274 RepID=A0A932CQG6_UNCTE|nr:GerMN domain-containing protein [Candidatus Tectomicrobia bacterium]
MASRPIGSRWDRLAAHKGPLILAGIGLLVGVAALVFFLVWREKGSPERAEVSPTLPLNQPLQRKQVRLFFSSVGGEALVSEEREIQMPVEPEAQARAILGELIKGSGSGTLGPTIPPGVTLREVFLDPAQGCVYVDFSQELARNHPGGSQTEALTVFSIVNSLILNLPFKKVQILIEGKEVETLAGHIFIQGPLEADASWVQNRG